MSVGRVRYRPVRLSTNTIKMIDACCVSLEKKLRVPVSRDAAIRSLLQGRERKIAGTLRGLKTRREDSLRWARKNALLPPR